MKSPLYIRASRTHVVLRDVDAGATVEVEAVVGVDAGNKVLSIGEPVNAAARQISPFEHPRLVISDFSAAVRLVQHALGELAGGKPVLRAPTILIQADMDLEGGISEVEDRVLREIAAEAGARKVLTHFGRVLTDAEVAAFEDLAQ
ncbi:MAG: hypothetical protein QNJ00_17065 [Woeseiaceae bacterium]|nr:hypothetical protein [Woeseiaceae bacterium]